MHAGAQASAVSFGNCGDQVRSPRQGQRARKASHDRVVSQFECGSPECLLDDLVGAGEERGWQLDPERRSRFHIDDKLENS